MENQWKLIIKIKEMALYGTCLSCKHSSGFLYTCSHILSDAHIALVDGYDTGETSETRTKAHWSTRIRSSTVALSRFLGMKYFLNITVIEFSMLKAARSVLYV